MFFIVPLYEARYPCAPPFKIKVTFWVVWPVFKRTEEALNKETEDYQVSHAERDLLTRKQRIIHNKETEDYQVSHAERDL